MDRLITRNFFNSIILATTASFLLIAHSCSLDQDVSGNPEIQIAFSSDLGNMTKGSEITDTDIEAIEVWAFLQDIRPHPVYFHDIFTREGDLFVSKNSYFWPGKRNLFFMAYPHGQIEHFGSTFNTTNRYLTNVTVQKDISKQVDLISAFVNARGDDGKPVPLPFRHALAQIEIRALNTNAAYNIKVKGVKIGKVYDYSGTYYAAGGEGGSWGSIGPYTQGHPPVNFTTPEFTDAITLNNSAQSIMGPGGNAMMMVQGNHRNTAWNPNTNPTNTGNLPYLAILVDIDTKDGAHIYPSGAGFAWTAVGITAPWEMGRKYIYTLDFSQGAGNVDPEGPGLDTEKNYSAGEKIFGNGIRFTAEEVEWDTTEPEKPMEL